MSLTDELGPLEIEFLLDTQKFIQTAKEVEEIAANSMLSIEASANKAGSAIAKMVPKDIFSDSQAEVEAYTASLRGAGDAGIMAMSGTNELIKLLNIDLQNGVISAEEFRKELQYITEANAQFAEVTLAQNAAVEEEIGILQNLKNVLVELKTENLAITDEGALAKSNARIQELEAEIARFSNAGKVGFDEVGNKIMVMDAELEKPVGTLNRLKYAAELYRDMAATATNPDIIAKYNAKLQETETRISQVKNVGKSGFDELGNKLVETEQKTGKFAAAIGRVTDIGNIGARVVTQFTRQIIGLGVGFLSLEIGAKAIESLIAYIQNLDVFTGRLDQAKQNMAAFNEVQKDADKEAAKQLVTLKLLYDTATNVNLSMHDRLDAAQQLRESNAAEFASSSALAIVNGELKKSYDDLTASIIAQAKSQAALKKVTDLEGTILDAQFQIAKNNAAKAAQIARIKGPAEQTVLGSGGSTGIGQTITLSEADQRHLIKEQTDRANLESAQNIKIAQGQIDFLSSFITSITKKSETLKDANQLLGNNLENFNSLIAKAASKTDLDNIKNALQARLDAIKPSDAQYQKIKDDLKKVDDLIKEYQVKPTNPNDKESALKALDSAQASLDQKIKELESKTVAKQLNPDQSALTQISNQFEGLTVQIKLADEKYDEFVKKFGQNAVDKFNADPTHKVKLTRSNTPDKADISPELQDYFNTAITNQANLNENNYIQKDIDEKKKLYADYQAYREKVGKDIADADYADLLQSGKDYQSYLNTLAKSIPADDQSGPIQQRRDLLQKAQQQDLESQKVSLQHLLEGIKTYETERAALQSTFEDKYQKLIDAKKYDAANTLKEQYIAEIEQQDLAQVQKIESFKQFSASIADLSVKEAETRIREAKISADAELASGKISLETYKQIIDEINKAEGTIKGNQLVNYLATAGQALESLGQDISKTNSNFGAIISGLGSTFIQLQKLRDLATVIKADGGIAKALQDDPKNAFQVIESGLQGIISLIGTLASASAQRKQAETDYYNSVLAFQDQYNLALNEQIRLQYQLSQNIFYTDFSAQLGDAAKALTDANSKYQESLLALGQGEAKVGTKNVVNGKNVLSAAGSGALTGASIGALIGGPVAPVTALVGGVIGGVVGAIAGIFGGKTKADVLAPLLVAFPDLIKKSTDGTVKFNDVLAKSLIANNQVSASTKILLQNTIDLNNARQAAIDQIDSSLKTLSGNLGSNLENALVTAFENGTNAAQAFGQSVSDVIGNIVQQFLFNDIFGDQFTKLQTSLEKTVKTGGSGADITADFIKFFHDAGPLAQQYQDALKAAQQAGAAQGLNLFPAGSGTANKTLTGQVQGITTDEANALIGTINALRLSNFETNNILRPIGKTMQESLMEMKNQTLLQMQIVANTKRTADNTDVMVYSLRNIDSNTSGTNLTNVLRAAGII